MAEFTFDYYPDPDQNSLTGELKYVYRPKIPIRLSYKHTMLKYPFHALVDSGADGNLFPYEFCTHLGINLKKGEYHKHIGIGSQGLDAYRHVVKMFVGTYSFETKIDFAIGQQIPLLGRMEFFRFFKRVTFNEKEKKVYLTS